MLWPTHDMVTPGLDANAVNEQIVEPLGVAVLIDGKHMCAMARGVRDTHSVMKVNVMHGAFQKDQSVRNEFLARLGKR